MSAEFEDCLRKGKIGEFSRGKALAKKEIITAEKDLNDAKDILLKAALKKMGNVFENST